MWTQCDVMMMSIVPWPLTGSSVFLSPRVSTFWMLLGGSSGAWRIVLERCRWF